MLDTFLRQVGPPQGEVSPEWMDWLFAAVAFVVVGIATERSVVALPAALAAGFCMLMWRQTSRKKLISLQPAGFQLEYDRWERAKRLKHLCTNQMLHSHVPAPVLVSLERTARAWHDGIEEIRSSSSADPELALQLQKEVDSMMLIAAGAAKPVVLSDEQGRKQLRALEEDADLMSRVCRRISQEEDSLNRLTHAGQGAGSTLSLRERLAVARREREAAEEELDATLRGQQ